VALAGRDEGIMAVTVDASAGPGLAGLVCAGDDHQLFAVSGSAARGCDCDAEGGAEIRWLNGPASS
jgi:hypothetical protein